MMSLLLLAALSLDAPDFQLPDAAGRPIQLSKLRGKIVLVNIWATHCAPCVQEMPWLSTLARDYRRRGVEVIGLSLDEGWPEVRAYLKRAPVAYRVGVASSQLADQYQVEAMPQTFLVDRTGRILWRHTGLLDMADVRRQLDRVLTR